MGKSDKFKSDLENIRKEFEKNKMMDKIPIHDWNKLVQNVFDFESLFNFFFCLLTFLFGESENVTKFVVKLKEAKKKESCEKES